MMRNRSSWGRKLVWLQAGVLVWCALGLVAAKPEGQGNWLSTLRSRMKKADALPPVEELYAQAESFYQGRETWWGAGVRRARGEESKAYQTWPGIHRRNYAQAKELFQKVMDNYPFSRYAALAELRMAECDFALSEYGEAALRFDQFAKMHPRHEQVPYALFQQGMCRVKEMKKPGRDQTRTREAIAIFEDLRRRFPDSPYAVEAEKEIVICRKQLALHELQVADFYFQRKEFWAAAVRYHGVWQSYTGLGYDDRALFMEGACYEGLGKTAMARAMYARVVAEFPQGDYGVRARAKLAALPPAASQ